MSDDLDAIIQSSIADLPDRDNSGEVSNSDGVTEEVSEESIQTSDKVDGNTTPSEPVIASVVVPPVEGVVVPPVIKTAGERALEEAGFKAKKANGQDNWMPHSRLVKIIDNSHRKLAEELTGQPLGEGAVPIDIIKQHIARFPEMETQITTMKQEAATADNVLTIMESDPARFVQMLLSVHPEYSQHLRTSGGETPQVAKPVAAAPVADMPQPDLDMGDGRFTYSPEGYAKLREWDTARIEAKVLAEVNKRYEPIAKSYEAEQTIQAEIPRMRAQVEYARKEWDDFGTHWDSGEIKKLLTDNRNLTLHGAYISVINGKRKEAQKAYEAKLKETEARVLAQIKAAPTSTSAGGGGKPGAVASDEPETVEDIIRASIKRAKAG